MTASTRCLVSSATPDLPLSTRETVGTETPASRAISAAVTAGPERAGPGERAGPPERAEPPRGISDTFAV
jgi:hypothetical protein